MGVEIQRGRSVVEVAEREGEVALRVGGPAGQAEERARYVVGCDGARSVVRRSIGVGFPGTETTVTAILGDVELDEPPARPFRHTCSRGSVLAAPLPPGDHEGVYRFVVFDPQRAHVRTSEPVTLEELQSGVARIVGRDFRMRNPRWLSRFGNATPVRPFARSAPARSWIRSGAPRREALASGQGAQGRPPRRKEAFHPATRRPRVTSHRHDHVDILGPRERAAADSRGDVHDGSRSRAEDPR
ncbi:FAD-dependent monooxygenase [Sorangium sp. So ce281]|uniref:FAD-dependent monooxygenase n=1 Tax=Sorangium sp. So ce281 TaxID=3133293 RepID=UPI003F63823E